MIKKFIPVLIMLCLYELAICLLPLDKIFFPHVYEIIQRIIFDLAATDSKLRIGIILSLKRLLLSAFFGIVFGLVIAMLMTLNKYFDWFFRPMVSILFPLPKLAMFPLLMMFLGIGESSKIFLISLSIFYQVFFYSLTGFDNVKKNGYLDIAQIYKIPLATQVFKIYLLGSFMEILEGIKLGIGAGLTMLVACESILSNSGIGQFIWEGWDQFKVSQVYEGILIILMISVTIFYSLNFVKVKLRVRTYGK